MDTPLFGGVDLHMEILVKAGKLGAVSMPISHVISQKVSHSNWSLVPLDNQFKLDHFNLFTSISIILPYPAKLLGCVNWCMLHLDNCSCDRLRFLLQFRHTTRFVLDWCSLYGLHLFGSTLLTWIILVAWIIYLLILEDKDSLPADGIGRRLTPSLVDKALSQGKVMIALGYHLQQGPKELL